MILGEVFDIDKKSDVIEYIEFKKTIKDSLLNLQFNRPYKEFFEKEILKEINLVRTVQGDTNINGNYHYIIKKRFFKSTERGVYETEWVNIDYDEKSWNVRFTIIETDKGCFLDMELQPDCKLKVNKLLDGLDNTEYGKMLKSLTGMFGGLGRFGVNLDSFLNLGDTFNEV